MSQPIALDKSVYWDNFSYFSSKTYVLVLRGASNEYPEHRVE